MSKNEFESYCEKCPLQCALGLSELELRQELVVKNRMAEEALVGVGGALFDETISALAKDQLGASDEDVKEMMSGLRGQVAEDLDRIDNEIEATDHDRRITAETCDGPLKMRARKNGAEYTVTVCTSELPYEQMDTLHVPTHVEFSKRG